MLRNQAESFIRKPMYRKLKAYAFDPSLSIQLDTAMINAITYKIPWEDLKPGPVGEYIEVVDYDPSSRSFYKPVNLDNHYLVAQDGHEPSESNPEFHQQMVYAVAMTTITNFEKAIGRKILWSPYYNKHNVMDEYVRRLRIYPHALREANAYYSPIKKSVLFGYFSSTPESPDVMLPGSTVHTCLSHDIIAHEITHALLDGMHRRYIESTHLDSLAFHEAFADIVALFQHFTFPEVLRAQIAKTRGELKSENLLGQLAQEFGKAIGHYGSLRDALGRYDDEQEQWVPLKPNTADYQQIREPHARGSILVATIFDAFINIYRRRIADLQRLATGGTGILPAGSLHPDLVNRMAKEASKTSGHFLNLCIRGLDYCPPMDINFGDYLRGIITSDFDLVDDDDMDYRVAIIEAFQKRGIYPDGIKSMCVEGLLLKADEVEIDLDTTFTSLVESLRLYKEKASYLADRKELYWLTKTFITGGDINNPLPTKSKNKNKEFRIMGIHELLHRQFENREEFGKLTGLLMDSSKAEILGVGLSKSNRTFGMPLIEIHDLKLANRVGPGGKLLNQIIVTLTQKRGVVCGEDDYGNVIIKGFFVPNRLEVGWQERKQVNKKTTYEKRPFPNENLDASQQPGEHFLPKGWLVFRGGSTLIFDLDFATSNDNVKLKYVIKKDINDEARMKRQYRMAFGMTEHSLNATYFGSAYGNLEAEPFAIIHKVL